MAQDNAAQAIKDLQKNLEAADKKLKDLIESFEKFGKKSSKAQEHKEYLAKIAQEYEEIKKKVDALSGSTDRLNKKQEQQNKQTKDEKANVDKLIPSVQRLAAAFGLAFSVRGLVQFGKKLIETRGEFELQNVALRSILQNKQLADEIWDKTMQSALQSPFTAMQLTKYTKQLAAYRIETDKLFETTKRLADVSAGLGVDMQRLILAYGQVKAANYLRASEIRQFTEAGVNILGELSQYFTETRNKMYSTAEVMEMVTKRMVKFEDVEAIFKRMTDQGGIFYDMQRIQSQTVKGQINKLHDAYDQMLNSIGKANEGTLKNFVAALNNIVKNWRAWAVAIKSIAWGAVIGYMSKYVLQLTGLQKASVSTLKSVAKLKQGIQGLGTALKSAWPMLAIAAVTAAISAVVNQVKKVNEELKEMQEKNLRLFETKEKLEGYKKALEENNAAIKSGALKQDELNKKKDENRSILKKLQNEYPNLVEGVEQQKDGTVELTNALSDYNDELERMMTINHILAQQRGGLFTDTGLKDMKDWGEELSKIRGNLMSVQQQAKIGMSDLTVKGKKDSELYKILEQISKTDITDVLKEREEINKLIEEARKFGEEINYGEIIDFEDYGLETHRKTPYSLFRINLDETDEKNAKQAFDKIQGFLNEGFLQAVRNIEDYDKQIIDKSDEGILNFIAANTDIINKGVKDGSKDVVRFVRTAFQSQGLAVTKEEQAYYNKLLNERLRYIYYQENLSKIEYNGLADYMQKQKELWASYVPIDFFAAPTGNETTTEQETPEQKQAKIDAAWRRRISLLEEMKKRYDELSKSAYGYAKSEKTTREAFDESFKEIFKGTGIDMSQIDFTSMAGMMESMKVVLAKAKGVSDAVKEEIMKKIDSFEAQITINAQVRIRDDFARQMEEAFNDYELTVELQKLNIDKNLAKDWLDIDYTSLGDMLQAANDFADKQIKAAQEIGGDLDEEDLKAYKNAVDKIEKEILKNRKDKIKEYTKYYEQELSERAKKEMEYSVKVAEVQGAQIFTDEQKNAILANMEEEYNEAMQELSWKSFKESTFYVEMMDDLTSIPAEYSGMMLAKINEVLMNPKAVSPRVFKEAINARQKILEAMRSMNPVAAMRSNRGVVDAAFADPTLGLTPQKGMGAKRKELEREIVSRTKNIDILEKEDAQYEHLTAQIEAYEKAENKVNNALDQIGLTFEGTTEECLQDEIDLRQQSIDQLKAQGDRYKELLAIQGAGGLTQEQEEELKQLAQSINVRQQNIERLEAEKKLYGEAKQEVAAYCAELDVLNQPENEDALKLVSGGQITTVGGTVVTKESLPQKKQENENELRQQKNALQKLKEAEKGTVEGARAWHEFGQQMGDMMGKVKNMGNAFYDTYEALGGETDALTEGWKDFGNTMVDVITQALEMIPTLVTGFTAAGVEINSAMGIIGLIAEAIQLVLVLIGALAKLHDAGYEKEIENQQKKIEELERAYDRLEKAIEKTWDTASYIRTYNQEMQNLYARIEATNKQIAAERAKKNSDSDKIQDYNDSIQDMVDEINDLKQGMIDVFGGIGEQNYRSAAEEFVDAWKEAFLETGDGLSGLQDHFDEFLQSWFTKQATMRVTQKMLEPLFQQIDSSVDQYGVGGANVLASELANIKERASVIFPQLSDMLEEIAGTWGLGGEGGLSGLAAGIQGMTEEQANILEAYWNSVRGYTASIDMNVARIADILGAGGAATNPLLAQMQLVAANTNSISTLLQSVSKSGHNLGGSGIKVFVN